MTTPDAYLIEAIREALAHDPDVAELDVSVTVASDKIFLDGTVATPQRRDLIAHIAQRAAPEHEIHNQTVVAVMAATDDPEFIE